MRLFPKRRWLRFSIRTLLVAVTIFCVWLGWQVSIVRERQQLIKQLKAVGGKYLVAEGATFAGAPPGCVSPLRRALGDSTYLRINFPFGFDDQTLIRNVDSAFPEAGIYFGENQITGIDWDILRFHLRKEWWPPPSITPSPTRHTPSAATAPQPPQSQQ